MGREANAEDDRDLVRRCRAGDERAFEELVRKYQQTVLNLIYHSTGRPNDVEDIAQKIFAKVYFSLPKFDVDRPFFPWLYRIAVNQCYDELRQARRHKTRTFTELSLEESESIEKLINQNEIAPESPEEHKELYSLLHRMLNQLTEQQRMAVVLRDLQDVPYERIARVLKCTEQAARLKVFRARGRLKELLEKALRRQERSVRPPHQNS